MCQRKRVGRSQPSVRTCPFPSGSWTLVASTTAYHRINMRHVSGASSMKTTFTLRVLPICTPPREDPARTLPPCDATDVGDAKSGHVRRVRDQVANVVGHGRVGVEIHPPQCEGNRCHDSCRRLFRCVRVHGSWTRRAKRKTRPPSRTARALADVSRRTIARARYPPSR